MAATPTTAPQVQQYQSKTVWFSSGNYSSAQNISGSLLQISRVQGADWSASYPLADNVYIDGSVESFYPLPNGIDLGLQWLHTNLENEIAIGLIKPNALTYCVDNPNDLVFNLEQEKNTYIAIEDNRGVDFIGAPAGDPRTVIGLGQSSITQYELSAAVGGLATARATINYLSATVYTGSSGLAVPAVSYIDGSQLTGIFVIPPGELQYNRNSSNPLENVSALGASDITMTFEDNSPFALLYSGTNSCHLRSFSMNLAVDRREQKGIGHVYPSSRVVMYPIKVEITTEAVISKYQADQLRNAIS